MQRPYLDARRPQHIRRLCIRHHRAHRRQRGDRAIIERRGASHDDRARVAPLRHMSHKAAQLDFAFVRHSAGIHDGQISQGRIIDDDGTTRVEGVVGYAETPKHRGLNLMQGPGYDQESTPGLVAAGATVIVFTTGRGTTIGNAIAPVLKLASNSSVFERMNNDLDLSAGSVIDGTESIDNVGRRVFEHVVKVASGEELAKAEIHKHREFQFWAEQTVSL